jgi:hypothetical protein
LLRSFGVEENTYDFGDSVCIKPGSVSVSASWWLWREVLLIASAMRLAWGAGMCGGGRRRIIFAELLLVERDMVKRKGGVTAE